jgi:hypothetical protein
MQQPTNYLILSPPSLPTRPHSKKLNKNQSLWLALSSHSYALTSCKESFPSRCIPWLCIIWLHLHLILQHLLQIILWCTGDEPWHTAPMTDRLSTNSLIVDYWGRMLIQPTNRYKIFKPGYPPGLRMIDIVNNYGEETKNIMLHRYDKHHVCSECAWEEG